MNLFALKLVRFYGCRGVVYEVRRDSAPLGPHFGFAAGAAVLRSTASRKSCNGAPSYCNMQTKNKEYLYGLVFKGN